MPFDPQADKFGRSFLVAIVLWGVLAGAVYLTLTLVLPGPPPPRVTSQAMMKPACNPTVPFDPPRAGDPVRAIIQGVSRCDTGTGSPYDPNALLRAYLDGAELDGTPHGPTPAVDAALLATGRELFERHCATCHGPTGDGLGVNACAVETHPASLITGVFALRTTEHEALPTDEDIFRTITRGIHGTSMPPWFALAEPDRWALVAHVKTLSKQFTEDSAPPSLDFGHPPEPTPARLATGQTLFASRGCASCHGDTGHGDGPAAASLPVKPRDFTSGRFHRGSTAADIQKTLVTGLDGTPMASFAKVLPADELWDLALFVTSLSPRLHDHDGLRCPVALGPLHKEEVFAVRNLLHTLPLRPIAGR